MTFELDYYIDDFIPKCITKTPENSKYPDMCWVVTNKFDQRVMKGE